MELKTDTNGAPDCAAERLAACLPSSAVALAKVEALAKAGRRSAPSLPDLDGNATLLDQSSFVADLNLRNTVGSSKLCERSVGN